MLLLNVSVVSVLMFSSVCFFSSTPYPIWANRIPPPPPPQQQQLCLSGGGGVPRERVLRQSFEYSGEDG